MSKRVLITGASVAGLTAALTLARDGHAVTVVERAPAFRTGGQNIDVRGVGRGVLRKLGLEAEALAKGTGEKGTVWVDADGTPAASFPVVAGRDGPTAEMEILRGDLAMLLRDAIGDAVTFRFGDAIASVTRDRDAMVTFEGGRADRYDAVIVAEGVGSATRQMIFADTTDLRWMDMTIAYFTIARRPDDDRYWRWYNAPGKRSVSLRPDPHGTIRAMLSIHARPGGEERWEADRQKAWLREAFDGAGWQTDRVLRGMETTDDFYLDVLRQVRVDRWSEGAVALLGDAAWCATPLAGIGTTLAVTGAYVLAKELDRHPDAAAAFVAYEAAMRPMVEAGQGVPKIGPRLMHPASPLGISLLHGALAVAGSRAVRAMAARLPSGRSHEPDLSRYD